MKIPAMIALAAGIALPAYAMASEADHELSGQFLGHTEAEIVQTLEGQGYAVDETEMEDGELEVEIARDGKSFEVEVDLETGKVTEVENEDDDD